MGEVGDVEVVVVGMMVVMVVVMVVVVVMMVMVMVVVVVSSLSSACIGGSCAWKGVQETWPIFVVDTPTNPLCSVYFARRLEMVAGGSAVPSS